MAVISTAVPASAKARTLGIQTEYFDARGGAALFLPQRIGIFGQGSDSATYAEEKKQIFSAAEAGQTYGYGSPIHLAALQLLPANGDGVGSIPLLSTRY